MNVLSNKNDVNVIVNNKVRSKQRLITIIYNSQKNNSKRRGHKPPEYSKEELSVWIREHDNFDNMYNDYIKSGCKNILVFFIQEPMAE